MSLANAVDLLGEGWLDSNKIAFDVSRKYGLSPDTILEETERRKRVLDSLQVVLGCLSDTQQKILLMVGAGDTLESMASELGMSPQACASARNSICKRLENVADEERIEYVAAKVMELAETSRGRHSALYESLCDELDQRFAVREALKVLFVDLLPIEGRKEADKGINYALYPFERAQNAQFGSEVKVEQGYKVLKPVTKCLIPEYMKATMGDDSKYVCCTLCATCKRKRDVYGRKGHGTYGLEKSS